MKPAFQFRESVSLQLLRYKLCNFSCDHSIMKGDLLRQEGAFLIVCCLPFCGFSSNFILPYGFHCSNSEATHVHLTKFYTKFHKNLTISLLTVSQRDALSLHRAFLFYSIKNASKQLNLQQLTHYFVHVF